MQVRQPALFIAHGSPMNAIADNRFTRWLGKFAQSLPRPKAILCISAHWLTEGSFLTSAEQPRMIYDMYGFPAPLYQVKYPAKGDPKLVEEIQALIAEPKILSDKGSWGLDHGTWSILLHMFPQADIPVIQLSIDTKEMPPYHFELGKKLRSLRGQGVLIIGSGNIVHNLRNISWNENEPAFPWSLEFVSWYEENLLNKNYSALTNDFRQSRVGVMSVPTLDHYLPSMYILGAADESETAKIEFSEIQNGSISMCSFSFGRPL